MSHQSSQAVLPIPGCLGLLIVGLVFLRVLFGG